jgi:hypothetical protein
MDVAASEFYKSDAKKYDLDFKKYWIFSMAKHQFILKNLQPKIGFDQMAYRRAVGRTLPIIHKRLPGTIDWGCFRSGRLGELD